MTEQQLVEAPAKPKRGRPRHTQAQKQLASMFALILGKLAVEPPEPYGVFLRDPKNYRSLSRTERSELAAERAWEAANPLEVAELDALVGRTLRLVRDFRTYGNDEHGQPVQGGSVPELQQKHCDWPSMYARGRRVRIFFRAGRVLLGRMMDGVVLQVRKEWVSV